MKRHVIALLYGQLSGASSLREIVTGMASHETRLYHVGAAPSGSARRCRMLMRSGPGKCSASCSQRWFRKRIAGCGGRLKTRSGFIHSTSVRLSSFSEDWATFSADVFVRKAQINPS